MEIFNFFSEFQFFSLYFEWICFLKVRVVSINCLSINKILKMHYKHIVCLYDIHIQTPNWYTSWYFMLCSADVLSSSSSSSCICLAKGNTPANALHFQLLEMYAEEKMGEKWRDWSKHIRTLVETIQSRIHAPRGIALLFSRETNIFRREEIRNTARTPVNGDALLTLIRFYPHHHPLSERTGELI